MIQRISTKWVLTVLAAVVVPFICFSWYVDQKLASRLSWDVVRYYLLSMADDLADRVNGEIRERHQDIELWGEDQWVAWACTEVEDDVFRSQLRERLNGFVSMVGAFDLIVVVDSEGVPVAHNTIDRLGGPLTEEDHRRIADFPFAETEWFRLSLEGQVRLVDQHVSGLRFDELPQGENRPADYSVGFAAPVLHPTEDDVVVGVVYGLLSWEPIQIDILDARRVDSAGIRNLMGSDIYESSYAWLWKSDADTILGHNNVKLYGERVSQHPINLPELTAAASTRRWGMYPEYEFVGKVKNAAFRRCAPPEEGGFDWVVGIGIDNEDIYAAVHDLRKVLINASIIVLGIVVLGTILIARRTTRPITELEQHTRRVASGDLDTRISVQSKDELGQLAESFNRMSADLRESRKQLVQAEKEAAWREMARQVAHEIKNPLTPIQLSTNLLQRAHAEKSPEFDSILARTVELIGRQVENMRKIAADFHRFAGEREPKPVRFDPRELIDEVLVLEEAWAGELGVSLHVEGEGHEVLVDPSELRRVFINLVSNSLEAMPQGGELHLRISEQDGRVTIEIRDTGSGLSEEARSRLFEPYFTTRSHGTGLGLAISKRIIDEMGGEIALETIAAGSGAVARVVLPAAPVE